jgi:nitroimidazol reductase NimA-like FMN-containing flavoprotein (pyridoxamine 5'-phosphate oxidase superfamily)
VLGDEDSYRVRMGRVPAELTPAECIDLLAGEVVGRVAICTPAGPRVMPVNYALHGQAVVFRTAPYSELGVHGVGAELALEVDRLDHETKQGWSVLVLGRGEALRDLDEIAEIRRVWDPQPWAGGMRNLYLQIPWREVSGRRVGDDWSQGVMAPYRRVL